MFFFLFFAVLHCQSPHPEWHWPVDTQHGITSSFGEYRGLRFHMGLDFSTGGVEGEPIRSANDGIVFQVRATERGYGRVAYVRHPSGHVTVYAHLAAFGPGIIGALKAKGKDPESYFGTMDLNVPVSREDLLAYSGESGAGLPHLHFEVRDPKNRAMDPLSLDFPRLDSLGSQTVLNGIQIVPMDHSALVNGKNWTFPGQAGANAIQAKGMVGFRISGYISGARNSRLGLRGIKLLQDGRLLGSWIPRTIDYNLYHTAGTVFDQAGSGFGPTQFSHAFDNRHAYLRNPNDLAPIHLPTIEKPTHIEIALMDQKGTWHSYSLHLDPNAPSIAAPPFQLETTQPTSLALLGEGTRLFFVAQTPSGTLHPPKPPGIELLETQVHHLTLEKVQSSETWKWETPQGNLLRSIGALPNSKTFLCHLGPWILEGKASPEHQAQAIWLEPGKIQPTSAPLVFESPILRFGKEGWPSNGLSLRTSAASLPEPKQLGIYSYSTNSGRWSWQSGLEGSTLSFNPDRFQPIVLARDIKPPTIGKPRFHSFFSGKRVVIEVRDQGSGIDDSQISVRTSLKIQPFEYDPDRRWVILPLNSVGPWQITVTDQAGNTTTRSDLRL